VFERKLRILLANEIFRICQCNITVISSGYQCIGYARALYNVTITGFMAGNIKDFVETNQLSPKLDLQIATLHVCNLSCNTVYKDSPDGNDEDDNDDDDNDDDSTTSNSTHNNITSILAISVSSCAMVLLCLILGVLVYRYVAITVYWFQIYSYTGKRSTLGTN